MGGGERKWITGGWGAGNVATSRVLRVKGVGGPVAEKGRAGGPTPDAIGQQRKEEPRPRIRKEKEDKKIDGGGRLLFSLKRSLANAKCQCREKDRKNILHAFFFRKKTRKEEKYKNIKYSKKNYKGRS